MSPGLTVLLCILVAGCATLEGPGPAREARGSQPALAATAAVPTADTCSVSTTSDGTVATSEGGSVGC